MSMLSVIVLLHHCMTARERPVTRSVDLEGFCGKADPVDYGWGDFMCHSAGGSLGELRDRLLTVNAEKVTSTRDPARLILRIEKEASHSVNLD